MCRLAKPKINKANSLNLYPKTNGYFRETYKSQNINLISPTLFSAQFNNKYTYLTISISDLSAWPRVMGVCKFEVFFYVVLFFFTLIPINMLHSN